MQELQASLDQGNSLLRAVSDCGDKALILTAPEGCTSINTALEQAKEDFNSLSNTVSQTQEEYENKHAKVGENLLNSVSEGIEF